MIELSVTFVVVFSVFGGLVGFFIGRYCEKENRKLNEMFKELTNKK